MKETGRIFVNRWQCDENDHLNVQFYFQFFEDALHHIWAGEDFAHAPVIESAHIRFHNELFEAACGTVESSWAKTDVGDIIVVHRLKRTGDDRLCAGCVHTLAPKDHQQIKKSKEVNALSDLSKFVFAQPRGIASTMGTSHQLSEMMGLANTIQTSQTTVLPQQCDHAGSMTSQHMVARCSEAVPHLWNYLGVTEPWLREHGMGRVAVELRIENYHPISTAIPLRLVSWAGGWEKSTFCMHHAFQDARKKKLLARASARALVMDLKQRKAVPLSQIPLHASLGM